MAKIVFLIDSSALPKGGASVNTAVSVGHPPLVVNDKPQDADYKVPVAKGENIRIYTEEQNHLTSVKLAPNGIIAHTFQGTQLKVADMKDSSKRPIDIPNFDMDPGPTPDFIAFGDDGVSWTQTPPSWSYWPNNPLIDQDLTASLTRSYIPYVTFNASTIVSGVLQYGLVFGLTRDGATVEYFYFDPYIVIGS
ncbi:hypothetical protein [Myxococcus xanthus]|uniref:Uncharacterized protein n=1 Tax=Myxococcus xanthus TaxID=34 RepID=A0AAE6G5R0_MYXXA|nr:hypothetical protein [Myxococcus xanthus]QDE71307.1 hypothetical protein BHS09_32410 [Myxococcus xanthus]QDE78587.1 hypothetical protein BHS08_32430 [Myxococcus xanthus]QDE85958.1 hypothetical protein BHS07_32975 [Myxococcus xanthus]QDF00130.1 hypothetical protein BHS05_32250 [Myxococcus xanthus]QDF07896.1 hypothetical protein BHS04_32535 [Myxococcus xanthus]